MDIGLAIFAIRGLIRIGTATKEALDQHSRELPLLFPGLEDSSASKLTQVNAFFSAADRRTHVSAPGPLAPYWGRTGPVSDSALGTLFVAMVKIRADEAKPRLASDPDGLGIDDPNSARARLDGTTGLILARQLKKENDKPSPVTRVLLATADVGLEFIGSDPGMLGIGSKGELLLGEVALNIAAAIPDDNQFGPPARLGERLAGIVARAGLQTLAEHPGMVFSESHLQQFAANTIAPVIKAMPNDIAEQLDWQDAADALMGPAAAAALETIASNQVAFFGSRLDSEEAAGAVTKALLSEASSVVASGEFTNAGLIRLYKSIMGVAVEQPGLFLGGRDGDALDEAAKGLLRRVARTLHDNPPPFNGDLGLTLAAEAIDVFRQHAPTLIDFDDSWEPVVEGLVDDVLGGLKAGLDDGAGNLAGSVLGHVDLGDLGKVMIGQVAQSPDMLAPGNRPRLQAMVKGIAQGIKADEAKLLTAQDWLEIAADAAINTAADNQELLFGADFRPDRVRGAMLHTFLATMGDANTTLKASVSKEGLLRLYDSGLGLMVKRPELFLGRAAEPADRQSKAETAAKAMFAEVARSLRANPPPFDGELGAELMITALNTVGEHAPELIKFDDNWDPVAGKLVTQLVTGFTEALDPDNDGDRPLKTVLSNIQLLELGRVMLQQAARNPRMLAGGETDFQRVVTAVSAAMAADAGLLLSGQDWKEIGRVAVLEAASNPGRLFGVGENAVAIETLKLLLETSAELLASSCDEQKATHVLVGETLREATILLIRVSSGSPREAKENLARVKEFTKEISVFVATNAQQFGAKEWLRFFRKLLPHALDGKAFAEAIEKSNADETALTSANAVANMV